MSSTSI